MGLPRNPIKRIVYSGLTSMLSSFATVILGIYRSTLNFEIIGLENILQCRAENKNYIITVWHTFVDAAVFALHSRKILIYSDHPRLEKYETSAAHFFREIGIKTLQGHGFDVLDASLGKQSVGILQFIKKIKEGYPSLISPDGPHGPIYRAKPGAVYIAKKTGSLIIPIGFGFSRKVVGINWDDFALPLPFSRVALVIGKAIEVSENSDDSDIQILAKQLEDTLDSLCFRANRIILHTTL